MASLLSLAAPARAAAPGTVPDVSWGIPSYDIDRTVALMREAGVRWARLNVSWASLEEEGKGKINLGYVREIDEAVAKVRAAGIRILMPMADSVPYWGSADPHKRVADGRREWNRTWRPKSFGDYADAFRFLVERYSRQGVRHFEVWNEPNHPHFWPSGPDPAEYARMLRAAYRAAKQANPKAVVVAGALAQNDQRFLAGVYEAGGGRFLDAVSTHSYPRGDPRLCWSDETGRRDAYALCAVENVREVMVVNGDAGKPVFITELGWSTCSNAYPECWGMGVSPGRQADYIGRAYRLLERYPYVRAAFHYQFRDLYWGKGSPGDWWENLGLLRRDFSRKPSFTAYKEYARAWRPKQAPRLSAPLDGARFRRLLVFRARVPRPGTARRVDFLLGGRVVARDGHPPFKAAWRAPRSLAWGAHAAAARIVRRSGEREVVRALVRRSRRSGLRLEAPVVPPAAGGRLRLAGRVPGAFSGRVELVLEGRGARRGRWSVAARATARVRGDGSWRTCLRRPRAKALRLRARYLGTRVHPPSSRRTLRLDQLP